MHNRLETPFLFGQNLLEDCRDGGWLSGAMSPGVAAGPVATFYVGGPGHGLEDPDEVPSDAIPPRPGVGAPGPPPVLLLGDGRDRPPRGAPGSVGGPAGGGGPPRAVAVPPALPRPPLRPGLPPRGQASPVRHRGRRRD